ncbi:MAG TPA: hypothetical protein VLT90_02545 [Terriglobales bacterium]|nr:hypothetical protein [Terriglobales bacterium]
MDRSSKLGVVLFCLFALPFAGFGLFALVTAIGQIISGTGKSPWLGTIFGLVFCGVGFGLIFAVIFGGRMVKQQQRAQAEHPAEPWLWREDWAQGRIQSNTRSGMIEAWIFAALWNAVSAPVLVFLPQEAAKKPVAYIALVFPVAGVFLLVRAIRFTLAYSEFGRTYFEMSPVPGMIGGELKGTIQTRFPHTPQHGIQLHLTCVNRTVSGSGNSRSTWEKILWRAETQLSAGQLYASPMGASIPVHFHIPWDAKASDSTNPSDVTLWQLEAAADVPGVDYHDIFEVPVFRTARTPASPPLEGSEATTTAITRPTTETIKIASTAAGTEFFFPAARNKGFAASTSVFSLIFASATVFLVVFHAPLIFPIAFGVFTLLLFYITVQMWFGTTRVGIGNGELLLQDGYAGRGKIRRFAFAELESITSRITSQQGGGTGTPYYDIELNLGSGRKVTLGRTIRNKQEVDWLVEEMRRLTGLKPKAAAVGNA